MRPIEQRSGRLSGRRLIVFRVLWLCAAVFFTALFLAKIPQEIRRAAQEPTAWLEIGLAAYYLALGLFIFWRRSDDWVAGVLSLAFMMFLSTDGIQALFGSGPIVQRLDLVLAAISTTFLLCLFYIFPDGRFTPRWTRWAAAAVLGVQIWRIFFEEAYMARGFALVGLLFITAPLAQIYRYRRIADPLQRQQIKWLVFGLAVTVPPVAVALVVYTASGFFETGDGDQLGFLLWAAFLVVLPLSITISILRYRLFDIDVIIRKTLVYTILTALMALVFFGIVVVLQAVFGRLAGQGSPLVIVISTLIIAALFAPLRRHIQEWIDRRFFRQKYNAQQVLARFAVTARDETNLDLLTGELTRVVQEAMQPEQVSVWLRLSAATSKKPET